jgi:hypothetical protein
MKPPILITGCARSGTSMVAGIVNMCGAFGGNMSGPNRNNQKGMFENAQIRQNIVKPYLRRIGADPMGQYPLPDVNNLIIPRDWKDQVERVMQNEGLKEDQIWMYKGAKMCLHWPVWYHAFPDAKWVIVRRKTSDIINSCMRTGFMSAFTTPKKQEAVGVNNEHDGWLWWVHEHEKRFTEMMMEGLNVKVVWPQRMVERNYNQTQELLEWLGLEWTDEIFDFIEPKLWKARQKAQLK